MATLAAVAAAVGLLLAAPPPSEPDPDEKRAGATSSHPAEGGSAAGRAQDAASNRSRTSQRVSGGPIPPSDDPAPTARAGTEAVPASSGRGRSPEPFHAKARLLPRESAGGPRTPQAEGGVGAEMACNVGDPDADGDGICDALDNCPADPNPTQDDADSDGFGDVCDLCAGVDDDPDGDGASGPCLWEPGATLTRVVSFADGIAARYNPWDNRLYVGRRSSGINTGLYRIEADGTATVLWNTPFEVAGVAVDPDDGDIYTTDDVTGEIHQTALFDIGFRDLWESGLGQPVGMAMAYDHDGSVVPSSDALVVDRSGGDLWKWEPAVMGGSTLFQPGFGVPEALDVAFGADRAWMVAAGGGGTGTVYEILPGGVVQEVQGPFLEEPVGIALDPVTQDLLILDGGAGTSERRLVRLADPQFGGILTDVVTHLDLGTTVAWGGVDVSPDGSRAIVTDGSAGRIYEITLDSDQDGHANGADLCPFVADPGQTDTDGDGAGDACDKDDDNDGVLDLNDPDPLSPLVCGDQDGDGCTDEIAGDGFGPGPDCDPLADGPDADGDGACDAGDEAGLDPFLCLDTDLDNCDDCSSGMLNPKADGTDTDGDGDCDYGDLDDDNDGVADGSDSKPLNPRLCQDVDADTCDDCSVGIDGFGPLPDADPNNDGVDTNDDGICEESVPATVPLGGEFAVNTYTTGWQRSPEIAVQPGGEFVVLWESRHGLDGSTSGQDGSSFGVFGRRFLSDGTPAGGEFAVNTYTTGNQHYHEIAVQPGGEFVVVWRSFGQDGSYSGVFGRRFLADGTPATGEFAVNTYTAGNQWYPEIAVQPGGEFVVLWESRLGQDGSDAGAFGRRFLSNGTPAGGEFAVNTYTTSFQRSPEIAVQPGGEFVVVWGSKYQDGSLFGIFGRRFLSAGTPAGGEFAVNTYTTGNQEFPEIAVQPGGAFVVVWYSHRQDGSGQGLFGRRFLSDGTPAGGEFAVNTFTLRNQVNHHIAVQPGGEFVVVWRSFGQDGSSYGIFGRRFLSNGTPAGGEFAVNTYTTGNQEFPEIAVQPGGEFVVVWQSEHQDGLGRGVFGRRFLSDGTPAGGEFAVNTYTTGNQHSPEIAVQPGPGGEFVVVWDSYLQDGSGAGLFGRRFGPDSDYDGVGDAIDDDDDNDGYPDADETVNCLPSTSDPFDPLSTPVDTDGDFLCDGLDPDDDNDGVGDGTDLEPSNPLVCGDSDFDACDDCTVQVDGLGPLPDSDPSNDGPDEDADGACNVQDPDDDNDGVNDGSDVDALDPKLCRDLDGDGCDDCAVGVDGLGPLPDADAGNDGIDADQDGVCETDGQAYLPLVSEFQVNTFTTVSQAFPAIAATPGVGFTVVWHGDGQDGDAEGVFGQRYDSTGMAMGGEFAVNTYTTNRQRRASVAMDDDGDMVVVWESTDQDAIGRGIFGQRYASDGSAAGPEFLVNDTTAGDQKLPSVAMDGEGDFVVAWTNGYGEAVARLFTRSGYPAGYEFFLSQTAGDVQDLLSADADADGDFVVVWTSDTEDGSGLGIVGRRFLSTGAAAGDMFVVNETTAGDQTWPSVSVDSDGDFVVAWTDADGSSTGIKARRYLKDGRASGGEFAVNTYVTGEQTRPSVAAEEGGGFVVTWSSYGQDGGRFGVFGRRFAPGGRDAGGEFPVNQHFTGTQDWSSARATEDGQFVVAWDSYGQDGSYRGIFARRWGRDWDLDGLADAYDPDDDNDGVLDGADPEMLDPSQCGTDLDGDGCPDGCSPPVDGIGALADFDTAADGPDFDGDGQCDVGDPDDDNDGVLDGSDCRPQNAAVWAVPEGVTLSVSEPGGPGTATELSWTGDPGGTMTTYKLLEGTEADLPGLTTPLIEESCLRWEGTGTTTGPFVTEVPPPGSMYWFLVQGETECGVGSGGLDGQGVERSPRASGACSYCSHDKCAAGAALDQTCDPCVNQVCAMNPSCCTGTWDSTCVDLTFQVCGTLACVTGTCAHGPCDEGAALTSGCDDPPVSPSCVQDICALDPFCCDAGTGTWNGNCVIGIDSICGLTCY